MACLLAILNTNDAPVDGRLLRSLMDVPPFVGPDRAEIWTSGAIGLGAAARRTSQPERALPVSRRDRLWAVMDGRLDDRAALLRMLESRLDERLSGTPDIELVLAAYECWGADCAAHLLGDFSFCVWDAERRQLVCARDHFGVKPLYYARVGPTIVISNVLRSVRRHPGISVCLDDLAVGDTLLFGLAMDPSRTMFADVSRLPPAHMLVCSASGVSRVHRYWAVESPEPGHYPDPRQPVEEFAAALRLAVADRIRSGPIGIFMSGGLDSSSVAAVAAGVLGPAAPEALRAFTAVYETVADEERHYSSLVATGLNIGIDHLPLDGYTLFDRWDTGELPPEPTTEPMTATTADLLTRAADHGGSVLTGDGGDPLLLPSTLISQIGDVPFRRLMAGFWTSLRAQAPPPPIGVRSSLRRWLQPGATGVPVWLAEPLRQSFDARDRWVEITARRAADRGPRSAAVNSLTDPWWPSTFEGYDPGATGRSVDMRYPFFDVRLVDVGLRLPSFPFCVNKQVLRSAMRGSLPGAVVQRPKTPLAVLPEAFHGGWSVSAAVQALAASPAIEQYVNIRKFEAVRSEFLFTDRAPGTLAAVCLAMWLRHSAAVAPTT